MASRCYRLLLRPWSVGVCSALVLALVACMAPRWRDKPCELRQISDRGWRNSVGYASIRDGHKKRYPLGGVLVRAGGGLITHAKTQTCESLDGIHTGVRREREKKWVSGTGLLSVFPLGGSVAWGRQNGWGLAEHLTHRVRLVNGRLGSRGSYGKGRGVGNMSKINSRGRCQWPAGHGRPLHTKNFVAMRREKAGSQGAEAPKGDAQRESRASVGSGAAASLRRKAQASSEPASSGGALGPC